MGWNSKCRAQQVEGRPLQDIHRREWVGIDLDYFNQGDFRRNNVVWHAQWPEWAVERAMANLHEPRRIAARNSELPFGGFEWHAVGRHHKWCSVHPCGSDSSSARSARAVA